MKLTREEAYYTVVQAWQNVEKYTMGSYRFGQALWNLLPNEVVAGVDQEHDFFYETNSDVVLRIFYDFYVES